MTTILVVDDSMMTRMMIKTIINEHRPDWEILMAPDAEQALKEVSERRFDVATVDMNMPGMSGLELIPYLQAKNSDAKIALLTANIQKSIQDKANQLGIPVVNKPVSEEKILALLEG